MTNGVRVHAVALLFDLHQDCGETVPRFPCGVRTRSLGSTTLFLSGNFPTCSALLCSALWFGMVTPALEASVALLLCKMLMELMELMNADVRLSVDVLLLLMCVSHSGTAHGPTNLANG